MNRRLQRRKLHFREQGCAPDDQHLAPKDRQREGNEKACQNLSADDDSETAAELASMNQSDEIVSMLQKLNNQLEKMQQSESRNDQSNPAGGSQQAGSGNGDNRQQQNSAQLDQQGTAPAANRQMTQELEAMLSQLLQGNDNALQSSATQPNPNSANSNQAGEGQQNNQPDSKLAQTAAQVLAKAQYELANELEVSLKKLKQVISESEKIANRISNLLGEENSSNKS